MGRVSRSRASVNSLGSSANGSVATVVTRAMSGWRGLSSRFHSCGTTMLRTYSASASPARRKASPALRQASLPSGAVSIRCRARSSGTSIASITMSSGISAAGRSRWTSTSSTARPGLAAV